MKSLPTIVAAALLLAAVGHAAAQAPPAKPPAQTPQPAKPPAQASPPAATPVVKPQAQAPAPVPAHAAAPVAARASIALTVTDLSGTAVADVQVAATGPVPREGVTAHDGSLKLQALKAGNYRLRLESPDFITLERDVTVKAGPPVEVDVALDRAPPKPAPPPPAPVPAVPSVRSIASASPDPNATVEFVALPDWIEKNLIGRNDPLRETAVGHTAVTTATVVQVRDPIKERGRVDADEMLYVIAGEGTLRAKGRDQALDAGSFVVVPRGVVYSLDRRGRNPLIVLSIVGK
jgi:mannose-6-phosphate isomerase-like protein (cupin superfamily)